jgi:hypothetical protein
VTEREQDFHLALQTAKLLADQAVRLAQPDTIAHLRLEEAAKHISEVLTWFEQTHK